MALQLYNTRTRSKEVFKPLVDGKVGMYSCGPTVYHDQHIGNLRSATFADVLKRSLRYLGFEVKHVMNITDVGHLDNDSDVGEDKLEKGAKREGISVLEVAKRYEERYWNDMEAMNNPRPEVVCPATKHIPQMIDSIKKIEENKHTYVSEGNLYFDVSTFPSYTELSKQKLGSDKKSRVAEDEHKRNNEDFVLWFTRHKYGNHELQWDSPWGRGFPGWHIECSAMSSHYLGEQFDIHTGGSDLIPIHHSNEIAQAEGASKKKPWVNFWMHGGMLVDKGGKMAKSKGDFLTLSLLREKGYDPMHYRYFCLTALYRQELMFSFEALDGSKNAYERLKNNILELKKGSDSKGEISSFTAQFKEAVEDDLNMPKALAVLWDVLRTNDLGSKEKLDLALDFDKVFGLKISEMEESKIEIPADVQALVDKREEARKSKDFATSDKLRDEIRSKGFIIKDTPEGPRLENG